MKNVFGVLEAKDKEIEHLRIMLDVRTNQLRILNKRDPSVVFITMEDIDKMKQEIEELKNTIKVNANFAEAQFRLRHDELQVKHHAELNTAMTADYEKQLIIRKLRDEIEELKNAVKVNAVYQEQLGNVRRILRDTSERHREELRKVNRLWYERCKTFRKKDADEYDADLPVVRREAFSEGHREGVRTQKALTEAGDNLKLCAANWKIETLTEQLALSEQFRLNQVAETEAARAANASLKKVVEGWERDFNMYRSSWLREIGGEIVRKSHEIDGFVLRTREIYEAAKKWWAHEQIVEIADETEKKFIDTACEAEAKAYERVAGEFQRATVVGRDYLRQLMESWAITARKGKK